MRIVGLMSGTSVDSIDAALIDIHGQGYDLTIKVLGSNTLDYPEVLRTQILQVCGGKPLSVSTLADLDDQIAQQFAIAAQTLIQTHGKVDLIASHGQTVFHRPCPPATAPVSLAYSVQLGRGALIAWLTGCPTVSNFRAADIAAGGEGAPLVPPVDLALLSHDHHHRCIQNIGGIGNVTVLPPRSAPTAPLGWDTGPGNSLIDIAVHHFSQGTQRFDRDGQWSAQGQICGPLLEIWLSHPYFLQKPPKSTGRETFGWDFFQHCLQQAQPYDLSAADLLATFTELTVVSIVQSYERFLPRLPDQVLVCGGGSRNGYLMARLQQKLPNIPITPTDRAGVPSDLKEAIAFAVLGFWHYQGWTGNLTTVTGAQWPVILGEIAWPRQPPG
ncbi:MAG: anhydro-N-acetylmuramic acid kinase [Cyanobacteria bacterium]|nr:anhydro-N-acetylmuramic acid kinase [Cyanobacteriota bacterium]